jgi:site-specific DNA-adenine methylase
VSAVVTPIAFLPSYVGSKRRWLYDIEPYCADRPIVELFAGSAIISSTFATKALLVDADPAIAWILSHFDELDVPKTFTAKDYDAKRTKPSWWRSIFYLAAMSRSGIFRWSKAGGFNVQPRDLSTHQRRDEYDAALRRWRELRPKVRWDDFLSVTDAEIAALGPDVLVVLDPPYEDTSDTYGKGFDTHAYWKRVRELRMQFDVLIFDTVGNLKRHGITPDGSAALRARR